MHRPPYHMLYTRYKLRAARTLDVPWVPELRWEVVDAGDEVTPDPNMPRGSGTGRADAAAGAHICQSPGVCPPCPCLPAPTQRPG